MRRIARHHVMGAALICALAGISTGGAGSAWAQALDRCNDILKQDLFNRTQSQSAQSQSAQEAQSAAFFNQDVDNAYAEYKQASGDVKKQGTSGHVDGHYGLIGGALDFAHSYDRELSRDEFKKEFSEKQRIYQGSSSSSSASQSSLIGVYSSSVRDPATIKAWETCMSRSSEAGLFAYGYRDPSGNPFITVLWAPGDMVGFATSITVRFVVPEPGMQVEMAGPETEIGMGSGTSFAVRFGDPGNRKAKIEGFAVLVNGQIKKDSAVMRSFQANAAVPHDIKHAAMYGTARAAACTAVLQENKPYRMTILGPPGSTKVLADARLMVGAREPTPPGPAHPSIPRSVAYAATLVPPAGAGMSPMPGRISVTDQHVLMRFGDTKPIAGQCNVDREVTGSSQLGTRFVIRPAF